MDVLRAERTAIEAQLRALLEQAPDGIFLADLEGRYTDVNTAGCRMLGYSRDELVGMSIVALLPDEDVPRLWESRERLLAGATDVGEWRLRRKDGSYVPVEVSAKILDDGRWQGFVRDISRRKASEGERDRLAAEAEKRRRWLEAVLANAPMGVVLFDANGAVHVNARAEELLGMKVASMGGASQYADRILFPDGRPVPPDELLSSRVLRRAETIIGAEFLIAKPDGSRVPVLGSAAPIRDDEGRLIGGVGVFQDVSERMRAEEAVAASERLLSGIFEILPVGLLIADRTGRFVRTNTAAAQIWGGERVGVSELGEYDAFSVETGERLPPEEWPLSRALDGQTAVGRVIRIRNFGGAEKTIVASALPLHDQHGDLTAVVVVNQDITELKRIEDALRRAVRDREKVLAVVAHDLRSPLSSAYMAAGLLLESMADESGRALLEALRRSLQQANRLIDDLLDAATLESGRLSIERGLVPAADVAREVVEALREHASEASLELVLEAPPGLPAVFADRGRLLQVLSNLVVNAIKFTPPGGAIRVEARRCEEGVRFSVADTGPGISRADAAHLFEPFWQARGGDRRGAGLGLAIAKDLVELHGGRIWLDSTLGAGSTFHFTVPVAPAKPTARGLAGAG